MPVFVPYVIPKGSPQVSLSIHLQGEYRLRQAPQLHWTCSGLNSQVLAPSVCCIEGAEQYYAGVSCLAAMTFIAFICPVFSL